ncbi:MAG TPA: hypothetical protein VMA74_01690 [Dyella sp.]|uniref:hypothetical protein n=1 Tax=Dyella sp. TaxID=1869338 RepID=UPI002BE75354|nr:hypothetical protein [Dyella sp.]HUB88422.1 hypothetical protein [Dyella sp.]
MLQPIKLETLRELVAAGTVKSATILGKSGGYAVLTSVGAQQRPLGTKYGTTRMFSTIDTAVRVMRELGVQRFQLDVTNFEEGRLRAPRPDVAVKAKAARDALAHDKWFRAQVDEALAEDARGEATWHEHDAMWNELEAETRRRLAERDGVPASKPQAKKSPGKAAAGRKSGARRKKD